MSDITVRKVRFDFSETLDDVFPGNDPYEETFLVAFSLTLPQLEPYLIRIYRKVVDQIRDEALAQDVRAFIGQEAQHHRNHHRINEQLKTQLDPKVRNELTAIEKQLGADYTRFLDQKSIRFNLAYAEGFEAMTCAMMVTTFERAAAGSESVEPSRFGPWQQLWAWHGAEEFEHRTVAFDVYKTLAGSYPYRALGSARAQLHFMRYVHRLERVLHESQGRKSRPFVPNGLRLAPKRFARTYLPGYNPANYDHQPIVDLVLAITPTVD